MAGSDRRLSSDPMPHPPAPMLCTLVDAAFDSPDWTFEPKLVAEIAFAEWTRNGLLRRPRYEGLRPDKKAIECHRERPALVAAVQ